MAQTGFQRSLTVSIDKKAVGIQLKGYPKIYSGLKAFTVNGVIYHEISNTILASMFIDEYNERLIAFKSYVQSLEPGLDIDATTVPDAEARRRNEDACPFGEN